MPRRVSATVDLGAIAHNCRRLAAALAPGARLGAVVKADGYGHGAVSTAKAAVGAGAQWLCVAAASEAATLRDGGIGARILVMGALSPEELATAAAADADVVAWRTGFVERLAGLGRPVRVHVKLDTGMGRLGTRDPEEAQAVVGAIDAAPGLEVAGVMTHFATADESGDAFFGEQLERFTPFAASVKARHPDATVHAANSAAVLRDPASHFDLVRCGIAVYGLDPFQDDPDIRDLRPALTLRSYVADVKPIAPGESAGYGRKFIAERATRLAVLPVGYGDGWRRALTHNADVLIGGVRRPLVGTVSMDNITVDVGDGPPVAPGDEAILVGTQGEERITAEEVARRLGTINYEITTGLTARVPRDDVGAA